MSSRDIVAILPAAGLSTRFPGNKLLYILNGRPIIVRTVEAILSTNAIKRLVIVVGHEAPRILDAAQRFLDAGMMNKISWVINPDYKRSGMSDSIKIALNTLAPNTHIMIHPADVALVTPLTILKVAEEFLASEEEASVACYKNIPGHPIFFKKIMYDRLMTINEKTMGLKGLLAPLYSENRVKCVNTDDVFVLLDIDSLEDLNLTPYQIYERKLKRRKS